VVVAMRKLMLATLAVALALTVPMLSVTAAPATWPTRPISVICGWAAGGTSDITARLLALEMEGPLGVRLSVTNITGALGAIGATHVHHAPPDGYTLFAGAAVHGTWQVLGHSPLTWADYYAWLAFSTPTTIYVRKDAPWRDIRALINDIRARPGTLRYGHPGPGSNGEIFATLLLREAGLDLNSVTAIPYPGGRDAGKFLLAGDVHFISVSLGDVADWARVGELRPLANLTDKPMTWEGVTFPHVTAAYPRLAAHIPINPYFGMFASRRTPDDVLIRLTEAFIHAVRQERLARGGLERAMFLDPLFGVESDKMMAKIESARSWPLFEAKVAVKSPTIFGIRRVAELRWPPHKRGELARPWPERIEAMWRGFARR
jgi:tripartite-type tricarboxylate transporter receptor subunit TctC